jgi:iron complex outermembrane receptor protein
LAGEQGAWNWNFSALHFETDGFREHSAAQRTGLNGKLRLQATPDTRVTLVPERRRHADVQDPLGLTRAEYRADPQQASPAALQFNTRKSVDQKQAGLVLNTGSTRCTA